MVHEETLTRYIRLIEQATAQENWLALEALNQNFQLFLAKQASGSLDNELIFKIQHLLEEADRRVILAMQQINQRLSELEQRQDRSSAYLASQEWL